MGNQFEYSCKIRCVCGELLSSSGAIYQKDHPWGLVQFERCISCGSWNQNPQITVDALAAWYDSDEYQAANSTSGSGGIYLDYESGEAQRQHESHDRYTKDIEPLFHSVGRCLEVGCASGSMLVAMESEGWDVYGVDLSERFAHMGKQLNDLDIVIGDYLDIDFQNSQFDIILVLGTVSNLQDFGAHLGHVYKSLKKGGYFYFNFPHANSWISSIYAKNYWMFTPSVSTFFTKEGMAQALEKAGFSEIGVKQDWQQPSVSKILGQSKMGWLYNFLAASFKLPFSLRLK